MLVVVLSRNYGRLAQLGERLPYKQDVGGSIPSSPTKNLVAPKYLFGAILWDNV